LHKQGKSQQALAQQVGISLRTVQRWLAAGTFPERKPRAQASRLDRYLPYLFERWEAGCQNIACLFRELVEQGDKGSSASVRDHLVRLLPTGRKHAVHFSSKAPALVTSRQAAFLFLRHPEKLRVEEQETVAKLRQIHPEVDQAYDLVQQFAQILRTRTGEQLDGWLDQVERSELPELQSFAAGVKKDQDAVRAGLNGRDQQWDG
jgi:transposase